jgi:hypothetical protein
MTRKERRNGLLKTEEEEAEIKGLVTIINTRYSSFSGWRQNVFKNETLEK